MAHTRDMSFISREFETFELPKEKKYLLKYFDTVLQEAFLKYVFVFGDYDNFVDHTGLACQPRWLKNLYNKLKRLESAHKEARSSFSEEGMKRLAQIESGKFKI